MQIFGISNKDMKFYRLFFGIAFRCATRRHFISDGKNVTRKVEPRHPIPSLWTYGGNNMS